MTPALVSASAHPVAGFVNTYTAPLLGALLSSTPLAPTAIVLPSALTDSDTPKASYGSGLARVSFATVEVAAHPPDGRVNTYADPALDVPL